jgi:lysophospholipase L1-like esterase
VGVNPLHPVQALDAAARNMAQYVKQFGGYENALRAYNAGPGAIAASHGYAQTNNYVETILGAARRGGKITPATGGRSAGGGGGQVVQMQSQSPAGVPASSDGLVALLGALAQTRQQPASVGLQAPSFSATAPLPAGYRAPVAAGGGGSSKLDVDQLLQLVQTQGGTGASAAGTGGQSMTVVGGSAGAGGKPVYVGDSLGVGTSPRVAARARNVKVGRSSRESVQVLRGLVRRGAKSAVFDAGTNDGSAQDLRQSLRRAKALGVQLYVPLITGGPEVEAKNRVIRQEAGGNLTVVDTSSLHPDAGDGVHFSAQGYQQRARIIQQAVGGGSPQTGRTGPQAGRLRPGGGYAGTQRLVTGLSGLAAKDGLALGSQKRSPSENAAVGGSESSDHLTTNRNTYAGDFHNGRGEDEEKLRFAQQAARRFGVRFVKDSYESGGIVNIGGQQYRVQILYGGGVDHADHVHVGVERI